MKSAGQMIPNGSGLRVAVLHSAFNESVVRGLLDGALSALAAMGVRRTAVEALQVPGAFELPTVAHAAAVTGRFDCIVALGAVIRGETDHYEHVAHAAATGLAAVSWQTGIPVGFGVLTVTRVEQALRRAAPGPNNKGAEAARAAVATARLLNGLGRRRSGLGPHRAGSLVPKTRRVALRGRARRG